MDVSRIIERVYGRLLREALDLGDVEFSPLRVDGAPTDEPDTEDEKALAKDVRWWLDAASASRDLPKKMKELMAHPKYGRFFHPPEPGSVVYRGKTSSPQDIAAMLGVDVEKVGKAGRMTGDFEVAVRKGVASWTYSRDVAIEFANRPTMRTKPDHLALVMSARVDDNRGHFIDLSDVVRRVSSWRPYQREDEVLSLAPGSTKVFQLEWSPRRNLDPTDDYYDEEES